MFRFIHAADIHLDSPLKGLEQYDGAPVEAIRGATRRALEKLVSLAIAEGCLLYTSPSPRDRQKSRMPSSA